MFDSSGSSSHIQNSGRRNVPYKLTLTCYLCRTCFFFPLFFFALFNFEKKCPLSTTRMIFVRPVKTFFFRRNQYVKTNRVTAAVTGRGLSTPSCLFRVFNVIVPSTLNNNNNNNHNNNLSRIGREKQTDREVKQVRIKKRPRELKNMTNETFFSIDCIAIIQRNVAFSTPASRSE